MDSGIGTALRIHPPHLGESLKVFQVQGQKFDLLDAVRSISGGEEGARGLRNRSNSGDLLIDGALDGGIYF